MRALPVITARGCAFRCSFCHFVFWDDPYRNRKAESVIEEIGQLQSKYNIKYINFWDDLSFASAIQMEKFCNKIIESGLKFKWIASVRVDLFSRGRAKGEDALRVAKKMKEAGCYSVGFALESGNKEILEMMNKEIDPEEFYDTAHVLREAGVICQTTVLFGYPQENRETIKETFDQCLKAGLYPSIGFLMPLPYTAMYDYAKVNGFITDEDAYLDSITERQDININMTKLSNEEIMSAIKEGAEKLNQMLDLGLNEDTYIRTKGYKNRLDNLEKQRPKLDTKKIKRNVNDMNFNYAQTDFKFEEQANS
jgi:anaerobic magnesium-protoporphyrin IX monomethyl ester cyclase